MAAIGIHAARSAAKSCSACRIQPLCIARGLDKHQSLQLDALTHNHLDLPIAQNTLYWAGDAFKNIYAVRSGFLKTYTVDDEGHERIRGFHLPGDLIGLDAISAHSYPSSAVAVIPSEVCIIPYAELTRVVATLPALQNSMMESISKELRISLALSGDYTAEQRIAAFLLHFHQRMKQRDMVSSNRVHLLMPRRDIAGYLRLAIETVSRVLHRFEREGWIEVNTRDLQLQDIPALWQLAESVGICEKPAVTHRARIPMRHVDYAFNQVCA